MPADKRILRRLADLALIYGSSDEVTVIPLTQDEVARTAGTTRPTVNKVLQAAAAEGLVNLRRSHIEICDPVALARRIR